MKSEMVRKVIGFLQYRHSATLQGFNAHPKASALSVELNRTQELCTHYTLRSDNVAAFSEDYFLEYNANTIGLAFVKNC